MVNGHSGIEINLGKQIKELIISATKPMDFNLPIQQDKDKVNFIIQFTLKLLLEWLSKLPKIQINFSIIQWKVIYSLSSLLEKIIQKLFQNSIIAIQDRVIFLLSGVQVIINVDGVIKLLVNLIQSQINLKNMIYPLILSGPIQTT